MTKTALVIGATGLVGKALVTRLLEDPQFSSVVTFVRRESGVTHDKLTEHIIDFDQIEAHRDKIRGDVLFSALGTTRQQAGSKAAQYKVDYTYQFQFAAFAAAHKVPCYVLVSSTGADADSLWFYPRIKGELERAVKALDFASLHILQPGPFEGERANRRVGEEVGGKLIRGLNKVGLFKRYRPISGDTVAKAMIHASLTSSDTPQTYTLDEVFALAS